MSDVGSSAPINPEEQDLLAAEYVLGLLPFGAAEAFEAWAERDPEVAVAVEEWERRLDPLTGLTGPITPPREVWHRIALASGLQRTVSPPWGVIWRASVRKVKDWWSWRWARNSFASAMVGAAITYGVLLTQMQAIPALAALATPGTEAPAYLIRIDKNNRATIVANAVKPDPGKVLVLWGIPEGKKEPILLAVLPKSGAIKMPAGVGVGATVLVSSEPEGGPPSPDKPAGPVVYEGTFVRS